jgi:hypothetical protein
MQMNQTSKTISERLDLEEAITRASKPIIIHSLCDDGEWTIRSFANEPAAAEYERKMAGAGVETRR